MIKTLAAVLFVGALSIEGCTTAGQWKACVDLDTCASERFSTKEQCEAFNSRVAYGAEAGCYE